TLSGTPSGTPFRKPPPASPRRAAEPGATTDAPRTPYSGRMSETAVRDVAGVSALAPDGGRTMIEVTDLNKWFGSFQALKGINLSVNEAEVVVVIGPSGSGKSTLIRCMNGLEEHQAGVISIDGIELTQDGKNLDIIRRETGMVFQQFNLFPHLTVLENIILAPLRVRKWKRAEAVERAMYYLERVKVPEQADKYSGQLSGGQQQRGAIARALTMGPKVML